MFKNDTPAILKALSESDSRMLARMDKDRDQHDVRLDKIETSIRGVDKDLAGLSSIVASNYQAALTHVEAKKSEIKEEVSDKYATKEELERETVSLKDSLSNGLNSLRNTAKIIWAVVSTVVLIAVWASKEGFL